MTRLSVSLSGGGHRAALFGLGALQYLADASKNRETVSISSVSGGSITNGFTGQAIDYSTCDAGDFEAAVTAPLARQIARRGTLFAPWTTKIYLAFVIALAAASLILPWSLVSGHWAVRLGLCLVGVTVTLWVLGYRGRVCRSALRHTLFSPDGRPTGLPSMHEGVDHVMCATELHSGRHFYFARDIAYGWSFGLGRTDHVDLATAVAASAAFPLGFPPLAVPTGSLGLQGGDAVAADQRHLDLGDGGVYDNMGDQWAAGYANRIERLPARYAARQPEQLMVVNSSAPKTWAARGLLRIPVLREFGAISGYQSIEYNNTTSPRRSALIAGFEMAERLGEGMTGTYVGIEQTPYGVADRHIDHPTRRDRAVAVLHALGADDATRAAWQAEVDANAAVGTQLSRMDPGRVASLVRHGYVVAMCNAHVILGFPLLSVPDPERFVRCTR